MGTQGPSSTRGAQALPVGGPFTDAAELPLTPTDWEASAVAPLSDDPTVLTIHAGPHARRNTVVCLPRPATIAGPEVSFVPEGGGEPWAAQIDGADAEAIWLRVPALSAGAEVRLRPVPHAAPGAGVALTEHDDTVDVTIAGELFTTYHYGAALARPYLHPVVGPKGARVTRECRWEDGPGFDHKHHKSIWVAHGLVNGTDNWSEEPGHGSTRHVGFGEVAGGPVMGRIAETTEWLSASGRKVLDEARVLRFYAQPAECRCLDIEITFRTGHDAVLFGDTKEGGLISVRVQPSMNAPAGTITNSYGGLNEDETWGKRAQWCDYSGVADDTPVGIALFDHPANPLFPTYWHVRNYGLMTANPFGVSYFEEGSGKRGDWVLQANQSATFRYRLFIHGGSAANGAVSDRYHDYTTPPAARWGAV